MTKRVMIVGIPGVGKSTVITNVFNNLSQEGIDTKIAEFGKIMFDQAKLLSIKNRDQLRKLSIEQQKSLQEMTANYINSLGNDIVIIDTHLFIRTEHGYYPGMPLKLLNIINPSHLILITAKSEEIHKRRTDDNSRQRDLISTDRMAVTVIPWAIVGHRLFASCAASGCTGLRRLAARGDLGRAGDLRRARAAARLREPARHAGRAAAQAPVDLGDLRLPGLMPHPLAYVFKRELLYIPFFGWAMARMDMIHIDRSKRAEAWNQVAEQGRRFMAQGHWVIMFPEGTRIAARRQGHLQVGGTRLADRDRARRCCRSR